jgi:hypothetical protein
MQNLDFSKIIASLLPVLLAAIGWLISSINDQDRRIYELQGQMMQLITPSGEIIPSPGNAFARVELRDELMEYIHDMKVRVTLLEKAAEKP